MVADIDQKSINFISRQGTKHTTSGSREVINISNTDNKKKNNVERKTELDDEINIQN